MRRLPSLLVVAAVGCLVAATAVSSWRDRSVGAVQRGARVAEAQGCYTCHGPGGQHGAPDPGRAFEEVPVWTGLVAMYVEQESELREWVLDGLPKRVRDDPAEMKERATATLRMPAWRGRLSARETDDLVAYLKAVEDLEKPPDGPPRDGRDAADRYGCFRCHGPQGRGSLPNPGSLKGYIPGWDGPDFPELAKDDAEIREWVLSGKVARLEANPAARFFLGRAMVKMPSYRGHIEPAELDRLVDYVHWLRQHPY